jgi:hypothetical protein
MIPRNSLSNSVQIFELWAAIIAQSSISDKRARFSRARSERSRNIVVMRERKRNIIGIMPTESQTRCTESQPFQRGRNHGEGQVSTTNATESLSIRLLLPESMLTILRLFGIKIGREDVP